MRPDEIELRIKAGEDARTELKSVQLARENLWDADDAAKVICGFANSGGGDIFVGVEDDGTLTGVPSADKLDRHIAQACKDIVFPPILCQRLRVLVEGHLVLVVRVPPFRPDRPFRAGPKYYVRDGSVTREARRDERVRLLSSSAHEHFDESEVPGVTRDELDPLAIREYLRLAYPDVPEDSFDRYLHAMKVLGPNGTPTVLGVLLFGRDPQRFLLDGYVTAIRFPGTQVGGDFLDRQEIRGRLLDQFERAATFIAEHTSAPSHVEGAVRKEEGIPPEVVREALQNALVHRDYQTASQTRVFVFDDRVEIVNPGELLNRLTLDGVRLGGISQRRNPYLASALARLQRRENAGIGVLEMIRRMRERGLPEVEFVVGDGHFRAVLRTSPAGAT